MGTEIEGGTSPTASILPAFSPLWLQEPEEATATKRQAVRPVLSEDIAFLSRYGVGHPVLLAAELRAREFAISASIALICNGTISEVDYYRCVAFELGLEFIENPVFDATPFHQPPSANDLALMARMVTVELKVAGNVFETGTILIAPDCRQLTRLKQLLRANPDLASKLRVTTHSANLAGLERRCTLGLLSKSVKGLRDKYPAFSAKRVVTASQAVTLILILQFLGLLIVFSTGVVPLVLHLISTLFYVGCIALRLYATTVFDLDTPASDLPPKLHSPKYRPDADLPDYSVLVALYQEAGQVEDLVNALLKLDWPVEKLDIKLVCEADDKETIVAARRALAGLLTSHISLVLVPPCNPRTKPKALNFALPLCRGSLVVIYDAEDRPSPMQLREAHAAFRNGPPNLACVQAPLVIINHHEGLLPSLFAIEYSALFDGLLPALADHPVPIPLGGTSNHFKRDVLESIGGWDPYNVTEDADLGIRLARAGCRVGTIRRPTFEEAPVNIDVWVRQRTRWFKGWYQTWLVHFRHPFKMSRDLGPTGTLVFHLMITGMIVSALVHPLLLYFVAMQLFQMLNNGGWQTLINPLFILDVSTILLGYVTFAALAWRTLPLRSLSHLRRKLWAVPLYWMLLSVAAWRALWHLIRRPHEWEKTPHRLNLSHASDGLKNFI